MLIYQYIKSLFIFLKEVFQMVMVIIIVMMTMLQESLDPSPVPSSLCRRSRSLAQMIASFGLRVGKILDRP